MIYLQIHVNLQEKNGHFFFLLLWPSYKYFYVAPLPELTVRPQRPLIRKTVLLFALY